MVPTGNPENEKTFPAREKSGKFEKTGKVREFHPKYWENEGILPQKIRKFWPVFIFVFL